MDRSAQAIIAVFLGLVALFLLAITPGVFQAGAVLAVGWLGFLDQTLPGLVVRPGVGVGVLVCLIGFVVATHRIGRRLLGRRRAEGSVAVWQMRRTAGVVGGVVCLIVGGVAAAGGVTQLGRMLVSDEPWIGGRHVHGRRPQSASNLRQIGLGLMQYGNQYKHFPPGATFDALGTPLHGWPTLILPYVDQVELYDAMDFGRPWDNPEPHGFAHMSNKQLTGLVIGIYKNPQTSIPEGVNRAILGYATNAWVVGGDRPRRVASITDGLAQTLLAGEAAGDYRPWGFPVPWRDPNLGINRFANGFGSPFRGGANFAFADGSVRFIRNETAMPVFRALATPDGGERVDLDKLE